MVTVTVKFLSIARQRARTSGSEYVTSERKLGVVLKEIVETFHITDIILAENGTVKPWARVLVNGRSHEFIGGLGVELRDGDRLALVYPYAENF
jgi:molybdopterin converting factor small subunit